MPGFSSLGIHTMAQLGFSLKRKEEVTPISLDRPLGASRHLTQLGCTQTGTEDVGRSSSKQKVSPAIGFPKSLPGPHDKRQGRPGP